MANPIDVPSVTQLQNCTLELPFFPVAQYELIGDSVGVWWFEADFSQSTYGKCSSSNRACTLIAILTASAISRDEIKCVPRAKTLSYQTVKMYAECILMGNHIYADLAHSHKLADPNLNVPEALTATQMYSGHLEEWKSFLFMEDLGDTLYKNLTEGLDKWWTVNQSDAAERTHLFVVLITEHRTILLVFQQHPSMISVYDSHQHSEREGCCISQTPMEHIASACQWIRYLFQDVYQVKADCYELSYIHARVPPVEHQLQKQSTFQLPTIE